MMHSHAHIDQEYDTVQSKTRLVQCEPEDVEVLKAGWVRVSDHQGKLIHQLSADKSLDACLLMDEASQWIRAGSVKCFSKQVSGERRSQEEEMLENADNTERSLLMRKYAVTLRGDYG